MGVTGLSPPFGRTNNNQPGCPMAARVLVLIWVLATIGPAQIQLSPNVPRTLGSSINPHAFTFSTLPTNFNVVALEPGSLSVNGVGTTSSSGSADYQVMFLATIPGGTATGVVSAPPGIALPPNPPGLINYEVVLEHATGDFVAANALVPSTLSSGHVAKVLRMTTTSSGNHDLLVLGDPSIRWKIFDVGVSNVWRQSSAALASGAASGAGVVLNLPIGTYGLVITKNAGVTTSDLDFTARLAPTSNHVNLAGPGSSVGGITNASQQFTCVPQPSQWTAVGIQGSQANGYSLLIGSSASVTGIRNTAYSVANGHLGAIVATDGIVTRSGTLTQTNAGVLHQSSVSSVSLGVPAVANWATSQRLHLFELNLTSPTFCDVNVTGPSGLTWSLFDPGTSNQWRSKDENLATAPLGTARTNLLLSPGRHAIVASKTSTSTISGSLTCSVTLTPNQPVPTVISLNPGSKVAGEPGFTLGVFGTGFSSSNSEVRWNGTSLVSTFVSAGQLDAVVPAALLTTAGTAAITVFTGLPGGGLSSPLSFSVENPIPTLGSVTSGAIVAGQGPFAINLAGGGFNASTIARLGGSDLPTVFVNANQLTATIPAALATLPGSLDVTVFNPGPGGGSSAPISIVVDHPLPILTSISPNSVIAGGPAFTLLASGANFFAPGSVLHWNGTPLLTTWISDSQLSAAVPSSLIAAAGSAAVTIVNGSPGGGTSLPHPVELRAPTLSVVGPLSVPVLTANSSPISLLISGADFLPSAVVYADSTALPTVFFNSGLLLATLGPAVPGTQRAGGVAIAIENGHQSASNARAVAVGPGSNRGTIVRHPLDPLPGETYSAVFESGAPLGPFVFIVDVLNPPPIHPFPDATADFVLSIRPFAVGQPNWFVLIDSIGLYGPAAGPTLDAAGNFTLPGFVAPNPSFGISLTLQSAYLDPAAPVGFRLSHARFPDEL